MRRTCMSLADGIGKRELQRLQALMYYEDEARKRGYTIIAGIDEAGRGPLAGPVVAAACVIPPGIYIPDVNDSKQLTPKKRLDVFNCILSDERIVYGIGIISAEEIDRVNIYQATVLAMLEAIKLLPTIPDFLLVDGMKLHQPGIPYEKIVQGDAKSQSIAAASVIAKETRDRLMSEYHEKWPEYGFAAHKGYGTAKHQEALEKYGPCPIHRRSFAPVSLQLELPL